MRSIYKDESSCQVFNCIMERVSWWINKNVSYENFCYLLYSDNLYRGNRYWDSFYDEKVSLVLSRMRAKYFIR